MRTPARRCFDGSAASGRAARAPLAGRSAWPRRRARKASGSNPSTSQMLANENSHSRQSERTQASASAASCRVRRWRRPRPCSMHSVASSRIASMSARAPDVSPSTRPPPVICAGRTTSGSNSAISESLFIACSFLSTDDTTPRRQTRWNLREVEVRRQLESGFTAVPIGLLTVHPRCPVRQTFSSAALDDPASAWVCCGMGELATREAEQIGIVFDPPLDVGYSASAASAVFRIVR